LKEQLSKEKLYLEDEIRSELNFSEIIESGSALRQALQKVATVAPTESTSSWEKPVQVRSLLPARFMT
jgi:formate hydrogenlyase transcriptional activator